jgi:hypothetical protein
MNVLDVRRNGVVGGSGVDLPPFADGVFEPGAIAGMGIGGDESDTAAFGSNAADAGTGATSGLGDDQNAHEPPISSGEGRVTTRPAFATDIERAGSRSSPLHGHCYYWADSRSSPLQFDTATSGGLARLASPF